MSKEIDVTLHFFFLSLSIVSWHLNTETKRLAYMRYMGAFLLFTLLFDGIAATIMLNSYLGKKIVSNLFLYHILVPLQVFLIMHIYSNVLVKPHSRQAARTCAVFFVLLSIFLSTTVQPLSTYNSYSTMVKHLLVISFSLLFLLETLVSLSYIRITKQPIFWIAVAFFFHSSFNIMLEGVSNVLSTYGNNSEHKIIYYLYSISNYCLFLLLSIGFIFYDKRAKC